MTSDLGMATIRAALMLEHFPFASTSPFVIAGFDPANPSSSQRVLSKEMDPRVKHRVKPAGDDAKFPA
jgi:hypothetical protein